MWQTPGQGTEVNIYMRGPHAKFARWASGPGDELRFAGGSNALSAQWSWQGVLTPAQLATIDAIVADANWLHQVPTGDGAGDNLEVWHVTVATQDGHSAFTVQGHCESVTAMWAVFNEAGLARFAGDEALIPKADLDRYIRAKSLDARVAVDRSSTENK